jgi:hypothetical protein
LDTQVIVMIPSDRVETRERIERSAPSELAARVTATPARAHVAREPSSALIVGRPRADVGAGRTSPASEPGRPLIVGAASGNASVSSTSAHEADPLALGSRTGGTRQGASAALAAVLAVLDDAVLATGGRTARGRRRRLHGTADPGPLVAGIELARVRIDGFGLRGAGHGRPTVGGQFPTVKQS